MKLIMNKILNKFLKAYMGMNIIKIKLASKGDHLLNPSAVGKIVGSGGHQFLMC